MAKKEEIKEETKAEEVRTETKEKQVYKIKPEIFKKGYKATIGNRLIDIHAEVATRYGVPVKESYIEIQEGFDNKTGLPIMRTVTELTDLSSEQFRQMTLAGVLDLTPEQEILFGKKFYGKK